MYQEHIYPQMVEYSISVLKDGHDLIPELVVQPYHCDYMHVDDLVQVVAHSSDFDQPHPCNRPHNRHPPRHHQQQ